MCVRGIDFASVSTLFFLLDFGTVLTMRYFSPILFYLFFLFLTRNGTNIIYSRLWYLYISIDILDFCSKYPNHTRTKYFVQFQFMLYKLKLQIFLFSILSVISKNRIYIFLINNTLKKISMWYFFKV